MRTEQQHLTLRVAGWNDEFLVWTARSQITSKEIANTLDSRSSLTRDSAVSSMPPRLSPSTQRASGTHLAPRTSRSAGDGLVSEELSQFLAPWSSWQQSSPQWQEDVRSTGPTTLA